MRELNGGAVAAETKSASSSAVPGLMGLTLAQVTWCRCCYGHNIFFPWASLISAVVWVAGLCCVIMSTFPSLKEQVTFYHIFKAHGSFLKSWQWKWFGATYWKWIFHQKWKLVSSPVSFSLFYGWNHKINQSSANLHKKAHFHLLAFLVTGL